MTVKQFFKGTAFKCIIVLTSVLLISGVLLAICWGFLEVTDEERFNRKIGAIYGGETVTSVEQDLSEKNTKVGDATIDKMWYINEKNDYLVQATSRGYGGDITCWIAVNMKENKTEVNGISKVILYSVGDAAELTGNISGSIYDKFPAEYTDGKTFTYGTEGTDDFIKTNASHTMTAICNDVNGAVEFVKAYASGGEIVDPFAEFEYKNLINTNSTQWTVNDGEITYNIVTKANQGPSSFKITIKVDASKTITEFAITKNGCVEGYGKDGNEYTAEQFEAMMSPTALNLTGKTLDDIKGYLADKSAGGVLVTGATRSNELCYNAAAFALANYERALNFEQGGSAQ